MYMQCTLHYLLPIFYFLPAAEPSEFARWNQRSWVSKGKAKGQKGSKEKERNESRIIYYQKPH